MALSLTCICGARFEVEDTLADQTVTCPECLQSLKAPNTPPAEVARRTNLLALLSAGLALVGAFTPLVGQGAAVVLGCLALRRIRRHREREAGAGFALFGIVAGLIFGAVMLLAMGTGELFGVAGWWRQKTLADQVNTGGTLEIVDNLRGFSITRPTSKWAVAVSRDLDDPFIKALASRTCDLMLVNLVRPVHLDVQAESNNTHTLREREHDLLRDWGLDEQDIRFGAPGNARFGAQVPDTPYQPRLDRSTLKLRDLEVLNGQGREVEVDLLVANQRWHMLARLYQTRGGKFYIVKVYAHRQKNFDAVRGEINALLDSFKIIPTR